MQGLDRPNSGAAVNFGMGICAGGLFEQVAQISFGRFGGWKLQCLERLYGLMNAEAYSSDSVRGRFVDLAGGYRSLTIVVVNEVVGVSRGDVGCTDLVALGQTTMMGI